MPLPTMTTLVYLLHGQADNIIPAEETLWMGSELPRTTLREVLVKPCAFACQSGYEAWGVGSVAVDAFFLLW
jgi:hypothetical protein